MKFSIICGSNRRNSNSMKVAAYVRKLLMELRLCEESSIINLADRNLPLWDGDVSAVNSDCSQVIESLSGELDSSDAFIVISPEWNGMVAPALKNFFMYWGKSELAHKPALPISVSSGNGGSYPIAELRMSSYKNNRICYLPEHLIVRNADEVLNTSAIAGQEDEYIRDRLAYCLELLNSYASAFMTVRQSPILANTNFRNGM